jgi:hypothetical protein
MPRVEKECPRCMGERGFWVITKDGVSFRSEKPKGVWYPCITCKTQGTIKVASMAEYRRIKALVIKPQKVQTKQREKER